MSSPSNSTTLPSNGLDYLLSAAEHLAVNSPRAHKYAVLHLFAGIELLLKERLRREHWSLIFSEVDRASEDKLASGDFKSVEFNQSVARLKDIAKVEIDKRHWSHLDSLRNLRNRLQHFHCDLGQSETMSRLACGISFSIHFIVTELCDLNTDHQDTITQLHEVLGGCSTYVSHRMSDIADELASAKTSVLCPRCDQETLMLGVGNPRCAFCGYTDGPSEALEATGGTDCMGVCPECGGAMAIYDTSGGGEWLVCFWCGATGG